MTENLRELGVVKLVQVQPSGLIIKTGTDYTYDPSRRVEVDQLRITPEGIEAVTPDGEHVLDIHHTAHPQTHSEGDNAISIGFTYHYTEMRKRFGKHMVDGIAGENIIIDFEEEIWLDDLGQQIAMENPRTGRRVLLNVIQFAAPCDEFSHFAAQSQHKRLPADKLKAILQFLGNGRRGFLLSLSERQDSGIVHRGDRVFVVGKG